MARKARIIVVGCSPFGAAVARSLSAAGCDVTVVDMREDAFDRLGDDFDGETVTGDGGSALLLRECGAERATHLVAATDRDTVNLLVAGLASEVLGVRQVLPVVDDSSLAEILEQMGIDPICPHRLCEEEFFRITGLPRAEEER